MEQIEQIELTIEEIKERLREGYVYSGVSVGGKYTFIHNGNDFYAMCYLSEDIVTSNSKFWNDIFLKNCLEHGELYQLDDPTLERR